MVERSQIDIAQTYVERWATAVVMQHRRIVDSLYSEKSGIEVSTLADVDLFIIALRNLLRAAHLAKEESRSSDIARAIAEFEERLPPLTGIRDMVEHFDDYTRGRGRRQKVDPRPVGRPIYAATTITSPEPDGELVTTRPALGILLGGESLDIDRATEAAERLAQGVLAALAPDSLRREREMEVVVGPGELGE